MYILPSQCICVFRVDLTTNRITSVHSIAWLEFVVLNYSVYFAVRTASSHHSTNCKTLMPYSEYRRCDCFLQSSVSPLMVDGIHTCHMDFSEPTVYRARSFNSFSEQMAKFQHYDQYVCYL